MFAALKAKIEQYWDQLTGEARAELEKALEDAKAEAARFGPLVAEAESDLKKLVAEAAPELKAAVESRIGQLAKDVAELLAGLHMLPAVRQNRPAAVPCWGTGGRAVSSCPVVRLRPARASCRPGTPPRSESAAASFHQLK